MLMGPETLRAAQLLFVLPMHPKCCVLTRAQGSLSFRKVRLRKRPNRLLFETLSMGGLDWIYRARNMGVLAHQFSEPLRPPVKPVPGRLASGHGALVG